MSDNPYEAAPFEQEKRTNTSLYLSIVFALGLLLVVGVGTFFYVKVDKARLMEQKALEQAEQAMKLAEEPEADLEVREAQLTEMMPANR